MKKVMLALAFLLLAGILLWCFQCGGKERFDLLHQELKFQQRQKVNPPNPVFKEINDRHARILNFQADVMLVLQYKRQVKVRGTLAFEKPKHFRMELNSIVGKELDAGSNDTHFWYWSKRDKEPGLYFAKHEDILNTGLRTPFNPKWLMNAMGANPVETEDTVVDTYNNYYRVVKRTTGANGKPVILCTLVDPNQKVVVGRYLYNENNQLIASSEVKEWVVVDGFPTPKVLTMLWLEENVYLNWYFSSPKVNVQMDQQKWVIPNIHPQIDMAQKSGLLRSE